MWSDFKRQWFYSLALQAVFFSKKKYEKREGEKNQFSSTRSITIWCSILYINNLLFKNCIKNLHRSDLFIALFDINSLSLHLSFTFAKMEFTITERGARMLIRNGFRYIFQKELSNNLQSWKCVL